MERLAWEKVDEGTMHKVNDYKNYEVFYIIQGVFEASFNHSSAG